MFFIDALFVALYFIVVGIVFTGFEYYLQNQSANDDGFAVYSLVVGVLWPVTVPMIGGSIIAYGIIDHFFGEKEEIVTTTAVVQPEE